MEKDIPTIIRESLWSSENSLQFSLTKDVGFKSLFERVY